jgi:uncharacterized protein
VTQPRDRFGLGWRAHIASELLDNLHHLDVLEIVGEHFFEAPPGAVKALGSLRPHVDLVLHGVSLGLASSRPVRPALVKKTADLFRRLKPTYWSEHLAFVRGGGFELNALAAPPRNALSVASTVRNIRRASEIVGRRPLVENAASVIEPPGSDRDQATWLVEVLSAADCDLLLDLHNVFANSVNSGFEPGEFLARIPGDRIAAVHLAGGEWHGPKEAALRLDTHRAVVPPQVYELLEEVGARSSRSLTVILEWDGDYPPVSRLLDQLERARECLERGRKRRRAAIPRTNAEAAALETILAKLYADPSERRKFLAKPRAKGISKSLIEELRAMDVRRVGLVAPEAERT